jgi:hypothetical protein
VSVRARTNGLLDLEGGDALRVCEGESDGLNRFAGGELGEEGVAEVEGSIVLRDFWYSDGSNDFDDRSKAESLIRGDYSSSNGEKGILRI